MKKKTNQIADFLNCFEEVSPPLVVVEETIHEISKVTKPIPQQFLEEYIGIWEEDLDEFTEIIPCFSLPPTDEYYALVYWKASLLKYEYIMVTLNKEGEMIARKPICSSLVEGDVVKKSAAKIDADRIIYITAGAAFESSEFDPKDSQSFYIEIMESGDLLFHIDENQHING